MQSFRVLLALSLLDAVHSNSIPVTGLSCLNDYVKNVSCQWLGSLVGTGENCLITSVMKIGIGRRRRLTSQTCKLEHHENFPPGCSFAFETEFTAFKVMNISLQCDGVQVAALIDYAVRDHGQFVGFCSPQYKALQAKYRVLQNTNVKRYPPGAPVVNATVNHTFIWWSEGSPRPENIEFVDFHVQIKSKAEPWEKAYNMSTTKCWMRAPSEKFKGNHQVRVRVKPGTIDSSHWSDWSPTVSWVGPISANSQVKSLFADGTLHQMLNWRLTSLLGIPLAAILVVGVSIHLYNRTVAKKQIPNPSKYFHALHSIHGSNLKKWLNPLPASQSFFPTKQCEHISPVQLCERQMFDVAPSTSPSSSSTSALLHYKACCPVTDSDTSGTLENYSLSLSSFYTNKGYFLSSSSGISARTDPNPGYFTYEDNFNTWQDDCNGPDFPCGHSLTTQHYESLKREPQSPDSGFCGEKESEEERNEMGKVRINDCKTSPLDLPHHHFPPDSTRTMTLHARPPPPPNVLPLAEEPLDCLSAETPAADVAGVSYAAWPSAGSMARSSSVNVEPGKSKSGYLTVKDLQMAFRNKSI